MSPVSAGREPPSARDRAPSPVVDGYLVFRSLRPGDIPVRVVALDGRDATTFLDHVRSGQRPAYFLRARSGGRAGVPTWQIRPSVPRFCFSGG